MLRKLIVNLRQRPKEVRDNVALLISAAVVGCVALVWLYHMPSKIRGVEGVDVTAAVADVRSEVSNNPQPPASDPVDISSLQEIVDSSLPASSSEREVVTPEEVQPAVSPVAPQPTTTPEVTPEVPERPIRIVTVNNDASTTISEQ